MSVRDMSEGSFRVYLAKLKESEREEALAEWSKGPTPKRPVHQLRIAGPDERAPTGGVLPLEQQNIEPEWETWWLPAAVRDWVEAAALAYGVPRVLPISVAFTAAATLLQGKVTARIRDGWDEQLTLWWLVSAPSTARKSPVQAAGFAAIRRLQEQMRLDSQEEARAKRWRLEHTKSQIAALRRNTKLSDRREQQQPANNDWRASNEDETPAEQLREAEGTIARLEKKREPGQEPGIPSAPRWIHSDFNAAMFETLLESNYEADGYARLAVVEAEGTWIDNTLGAHSGKLEITSYLKGYGGEPIDKVRRNPASAELVSRHIGAAYLSLCCCVQAGVLARLLSEDGVSERGFIGRCIISRADRLMPAPEYDTPRIPNHIQAAYDAWLLSMHAVTPGYVDVSDAMAPGCPLRALYDEVRVKVAQDGEGASAWQLRTVGRIARLLAILRLSGGANACSRDRQQEGTYAPIVDDVEVLTGRGGVGGMREVDQIAILISLLYSRVLTRAQATEPHTGPLSADALTLLRTLGGRQQSTTSTNSRQLQVASVEMKRMGSERIRNAMVLLAESGHLRPNSDKDWDRVLRAGRGVLHADVICLDPEGAEAPAQTAQKTATTLRSDSVGDDLT